MTWENRPGSCGRPPSPCWSTYRTSFRISGVGLDDLLCMGGHSWGLVVMRALLSPGAKCQLPGTEGQNPPSPPLSRRLEGSLWSAPQLGKERVPECVKSLTPGPRHEVLETPDSRCPLRPGEGVGSGGQSVRSFALPLCLLQSAQGSLGGLSDVLLVLPKRQNIPGSRGHAGSACRCQAPAGPPETCAAAPRPSSALSCGQ